MIAIRSLPSNADQRRAIRDTWAASYNFPHLVTPLVFMVGATNRTSVMTDLTMESRVYGDIIQEDFIDSPWNLSLKSHMRYKWVNKHCSNAQLVLMADDNVVVDVFKLIPFLKSQMAAKSDDVIMCYLHPCCQTAGSLKYLWGGSHKPDRYSSSHRSISPYGGDAYPSHCSSAAYIVPLAAINKLHRMASHTPIFIPEEVWTGVLVEKIGLSYVDIYRFYAGLYRDTETKAKTIMTMPLLKQFNHSTYLQSSVMIGVADSNRNVAGSQVRTLWHAIVYQHQDQSRFGLLEDSGVGWTDDAGRDNNHIYSIAGAALLLDIVVIFVIAYVIICRKRQLFYGGKTLYRVGR